jgi:hypothetical protein
MVAIDAEDRKGNEHGQSGFSLLSRETENGFPESSTWHT